MKVKTICVAIIADGIAHKTVATCLEGNTKFIFMLTLKTQRLLVCQDVLSTDPSLCTDLLNVVKKVPHVPKRVFFLCFPVDLDWVLDTHEAPQVIVLTAGVGSHETMDHILSIDRVLFSGC